MMHFVPSGNVERKIRFAFFPIVYRQGVDLVGSDGRVLDHYIITALDTKGGRARAGLRTWVRSHNYLIDTALRAARGDENEAVKNLRKLCIPSNQ